MRLKYYTANADDITDIQTAELSFVLFFAQHIDFEVNLNIARAVIQRTERRFTMTTDSHQTAGNKYFGAFFNPNGSDTIRYRVENGRFLSA